jgi:Cu2+-containing amine oxidase
MPGVDVVVNPPLPTAVDGVHKTNGINGDHAEPPAYSVKEANGTNTTNGSNGVKKEQPSGPSHPLGPLTAAEISQASGAIRTCWPEGTLFQFKSIMLSEPAKAEMVSYLDAEHKGLEPKPIDRRAFVLYYIRNTVCLIRTLGGLHETALISS